MGNTFRERSEIRRLKSEKPGACSSVWLERTPDKREVDGSIPSRPTRIFCGSLFGGVAQLGERLPCTQEVIGSNPFTSTKLSSPKTIFPDRWLKTERFLFPCAKRGIRSLFDNLFVNAPRIGQHDCVNCFVAKLLRAVGGCLGAKWR